MTREDYQQKLAAGDVTDEKNVSTVRKDGSSLWNDRLPPFVSMSLEQRRCRRDC